MLQFFTSKDHCKNFESFKTETIHEVALLKLMLKMCKEKNSENDNKIQILRTQFQKRNFSSNDFGFWDYNISDFANETIVPHKELK